eukprot:942752-Pelagomonas_calceolata.AAC.1
MLDESVSPAADQPDSRAVGQPLVTLPQPSVYVLALFQAFSLASFVWFRFKILPARSIKLQAFLFTRSGSVRFVNILSMIGEVWTA